MSKLFASDLFICWFQKALQEEEAAGIYNKIIMLTARKLSQQNFNTFADFYRANVSVSPTVINATGKAYLIKLNL